MGIIRKLDKIADRKIEEIVTRELGPKKDQPKDSQKGGKK